MCLLKSLLQLIRSKDIFAVTVNVLTNAALSVRALVPYLSVHRAFVPEVAHDHLSF
jgi:hypothetical protein